MTKRIVFALLFVIALPVFGGTNRWTAGAPPQAECDPNYIRCSNAVGLAVDPLNENILYVAYSTGKQQASDRHGIWRSDDGGATWTRLPVGEIDWPVAVRISPVDGMLYLLTRSSLYRSPNGGALWQKMTSPAFYVDSTDLICDPLDASVLYLAQANACGFGNCIEGGVKRSDDRGQHWSDAGLKKVTVSQLAIDPVDSSTVYAVSEGRLYQSGNRGGSWKTITPTGAPSISTVVVDPTVSSVVYTTGGTYSAPLTGIYKSTDRARTWRLLQDETFKPGGPNLLAIDALHPLQLLATNGYGTVIRSTNGGESWSVFNEGLVGASVRQLIIGASGTTFHAVADNGYVFHYRIAHPRRRVAGK